MKRFAAAIRLLRSRAGFRWALTNVLALAAVAIVSIFVSHPASAQAGGVLGSCPSGGVLDAVPGIYCQATLAWLRNGLQAAQQFFLVLVGIELAWSALLWTLQKENLGELLTAFILKLMGIFFFYALLMFGAQWLPLFLQGFIGLAAQVTTPNQPPMSLDPMTIFQLGINICNLIFANLPHPSFDFNPAHLLPLPVIAIVNDLLSWYFFEIIFVFSCIICFVVFLSFLIAAGQLIMTLVEAYIMIGAGAVMLGFTGSRWTMSFGEKWIGYAFAIGVKLFVIYIIVALGVNIFPSSCPSGNDVVGLCSQFGQIAGTSLSIDITNINGSTFNVSQIFTAYLEIAASAIIFMMLCQRLPGLAASMMNGSPNLTAGAAIATAMQVSNAVTGVIKAGAGAAAGAAGGAGGAASLGGGGGGLMEAASIDDGIGGGGTMSPGQTSLGSEAKGGGFGDGPVTSDVTSSSSLSNGSSAIGSTANGSNTKGDVGSPVSSNGTIGQPSAAKSGVSGSAIAKELVGAVSAATSPLIGFDEGGGGGSVHIGLKLPE